LVVLVALTAWGGEAGATTVRAEAEVRIVVDGAYLRSSSTSYHGTSPACDVTVSSTVEPRLIEPDKLIVEGTLLCVPSAWMPIQTVLGLWRDPDTYVDSTFHLFRADNLRLEVDDPVGGTYHADFQVEFAGGDNRFPPPPADPGTTGCTMGANRSYYTLRCAYTHVFVVAALPVGGVL
jgi:hypothetical protein